MFDCVPKTSLMPVYVGLCLLPTLSKVLYWRFYTDFFHLDTKKVVAGQVRQVVFLQSNNCLGICLGALSIGGLTELSSSYRGSCLNRFDCSINCYWSNKIYFLFGFFSWVILANFHNGISKLTFIVVLSYILYNIY